MATGGTAVHAGGRVLASRALDKTMRERTDLQDDDAEEVPTGDGTADGEAVITCPYCGESVELALDAGSGSRQEYVEDCEVCCRPWRVLVRYDRRGHASVQINPLSE